MRTRYDASFHLFTGMERGFLFLAIFANAKQIHAMAFQGEAVAFTHFQLILLNERVFKLYGFFADFAYQMIVVPNLEKTFVGGSIIEGVHFRKPRFNQ